MSDLKPCPFCGSQNVAARNWWNSLYETRFFAECYDCGCMVGFMADPSGWVGAAYYTEAEAIEAWNARYERTCEVTYGEHGCPYCGECGCVLYSTSGYCPNCGVRIKEDTDAD